MPWGKPDIFVPIPLILTVKDDYWKEDKELKTQFAVALCEGNKPFEAACLVFGKETNKALWASTNWLNDPVVIQAKQEFSKVEDDTPKILDKTELSLRLLSFSEEKVIYNGNEVYAAEAKDRLSALKLYAEIQGFVNNKTEINNTVNNNNRLLEIKLVEPEKKENVKTIEHSPVNEDEIDILENSPIKLKLVG